MKPIYSSIPVELCIYGLINSKVNHIKLLVYLKHIASGHVKQDTSLYKFWASDLGVSERWIREAISWMIKEKWITVNGKMKSLRVVSYYQICRQLKFTCNLSAKFDGSDFEEFKNFCCAVALTFFLRRKNYIDKNRRPVSKMADTRKSRNRNLKGYIELPIRYFATCLGVSVSTANNFKISARNSGMVSVKRQIVTITDFEGKCLQKNVSSVFFKSDKGFAGRLRIGKKYLKCVESDLIKSNIVCTKKCFKNGEKL